MSQLQRRLRKCYRMRDKWKAKDDISGLIGYSDQMVYDRFYRITTREWMDPKPLEEFELLYPADPPLPFARPRPTPVARVVPIQRRQWGTLHRVWSTGGLWQENQDNNEE